MSSSIQYIWAGLVVDQEAAEILMEREYGDMDMFSDFLAAIMTLQQGDDEEALNCLMGWTVLQIRWMPKHKNNTHKRFSTYIV